MPIFRSSSFKHPFPFYQKIVILERMENGFKNFQEFWPHYMNEHRDPRSRRLHFVGTSLAFVIVLVSLLTQTWWGIAVAVVCGYLFAWIGHFFVEKNRPATFRHPFYSLLGDFKMWWLILLGKI